MKNKWLSVENIMFAATFIVATYYKFYNKDDEVYVYIFAAFGLLPYLAEKTFPKLLEYQMYLSTIQNLKYSCSFFIAGIVLSRVSTQHIVYSSNQAWATAYFFIIILGASFIYAIFINQNKMEEIIAKNTKALSRSSVKGFDELITTIAEKKGNVLLVAGNLLSLKTDPGTQLLIKFLDQNSSNVLKLVVPTSSGIYISELKNKIIAINQKYLSRISVTIQEPFWFLQGIVIIGKLSFLIMKILLKMVSI
jgi:hypothetical protein